LSGPSDEREPHAEPLGRDVAQLSPKTVRQTPGPVCLCAYCQQERQDRTCSMSMRIISPGRLFALICLLAVWAGLQGARAVTLPAAPNCTIGNGDLDFQKVPVSSTNIPSQETASGYLTVDCNTAPNTTVFVCVPVVSLLTAQPDPGSGILYYTLAAVNKQVSSNHFQIPIEGTISANQKNIPAGSYNARVFANEKVTYSFSNCLTAPISFNPQPYFHANAFVQKSCSVSTNPLIFASTSSLQAGQTGKTSITVRCNWVAVYSVALSGGNINASDPTQRKMSLNGNPSDPNAITYGLYVNENCKLPWGAQTTVGGNSSTAGPDLPVYGCVPPQPTPSQGTYSDTIVVTLTF
jgi:spore coat protein U-like protein